MGCSGVHITEITQVKLNGLTYFSTSVLHLVIQVLSTVLWPSSGIHRTFVTFVTLDEIYRGKVQGLLQISLYTLQ